MIKNALIKCFNQFDLYARKVLKPNVYLRYAQLLIPILSLKRRANISFRIMKPNLICVIQDYRKYYFFNPYRARRYVVNDGFYEAGHRLAKNYKVENVNIGKYDIVVEVGASVGEFSIWAARKGANVYAFEVDPLALECLTRNITYYDNISVIDKACSDIDGYGYIYLDSDGASSTMLKPEKEMNKSNFYKVETITLGRWIGLQNIHSVRILKVEAEGFEPEVLKGLGNCINIIDYITIDAGPERYGSSTISQVSEILTNNNFKCNVYGNYVLGINNRI